MQHIDIFNLSMSSFPLVCPFVIMAIAIAIQLHSAI